MELYSYTKIFKTSHAKKELNKWIRNMCTNFINMGTNFIQLTLKWRRAHKSGQVLYFWGTSSSPIDQRKILHPPDRKLQLIVLPRTHTTERHQSQPEILFLTIHIEIPVWYYLNTMHGSTRWIHNCIRRDAGEKVWLKKSASNAWLTWDHISSVRNI